MITQTVTLEACEIFALFRPESFSRQYNKIDNLEIKKGKKERKVCFCLFVCFFNVDLNAFDSDTDRTRNPNRVTPVPNFLYR